MQDRKLLHKKELIIISVILILGIGIWLFFMRYYTPPSPGQGAHIEDDTQVEDNALIEDDTTLDENALNEDDTYTEDEAHIYGEVYYWGDMVKAVPLHIDQTFSIEHNPYVVFEVRDGAIAFVKSNCSDQVCIHMGFIDRPWHFAACLPNALLLRVQFDEE